MAAADQTANLKQKVYQGTQPVQMLVVKVTQNDWISFSKYKGVDLPSGSTFTAAANVVEIPTYGTMAINNAGTAYGATDTSIVIQTALATRYPPYYLATAGGEIMLVNADSTPTATTSTLTVQRGVLGTTATGTGIANTNVVAILNQIVLGSSSVGPTLMAIRQLIGDPTPSDAFK